VSANQKAAEEFVQDPSDCVKANGFIHQQVFNCDETGLFWRTMPRRTYITQEESRNGLIHFTLIPVGKIGSVYERPSGTN
jgi:hypothetical protein